MRKINIYNITNNINMQQFDFDVNCYLPKKDDPFYKYTSDWGCHPEFRYTTDYNKLFETHDIFGKKYNLEFLGFCIYIFTNSRILSLVIVVASVLRIPLNILLIYL